MADPIKPSSTFKGIEFMSRIALMIHPPPLDTQDRVWSDLQPPTCLKAPKMTSRTAGLSLWSVVEDQGWGR